MEGPFISPRQVSAVPDRRVCGTVLDQIADTVRSLPSIPELLIGADNALSPRARLGARSMADIACQAVRSVNYSK